MFKSDRLKKQVIKRKPGKIREKLFVFNDENLLKIGIILVCILFFLGISFLYPNYSAWNGIENKSNTNYQFISQVDPGYSRTLITVLSKQDTKRIVSYQGILVMDKNSKTYSLYALNLDTKVKVDNVEYSLSNLYDKDSEKYFSNLLNNLNLSLENAILVNDDVVTTLGEAYGMKAGFSEEYMENLFSNIKAEWIPFFKQNSFAKFYSDSVTNFTTDQFKELAQNLRDFKIDKNKKLTDNVFSGDDTNYFADKALTNEQLRVEVSNATSQNGLGNAYAEKFKNIGINVSKVSTFELKSPKNLIYVADNLVNSVTMKSILQLVGDCEIVHQKPVEFSSADILVVVTK